MVYRKQFPFFRFQIFQRLMIPGSSGLLLMILVSISDDARGERGGKRKSSFPTYIIVIFLAPIGFCTKRAGML